MKGFCVLLHLNTLFMNQECRRIQSEYSNLNKQCHEARVLKNTNRLYLNKYSQTKKAFDIHFVTNESDNKLILFERRFDVIFTSFSSSFKVRYC